MRDTREIHDREQKYEAEKRIQRQRTAKGESNTTQRERERERRRRRRSEAPSRAKPTEKRERGRRETLVLLVDTIQGNCSVFQHAKDPRGTSRVRPQRTERLLHPFLPIVPVF